MEIRNIEINNPELNKKIDEVFKLMNISTKLEKEKFKQVKMHIVVSMALNYLDDIDEATAVNLTIKYNDEYLTSTVGLVEGINGLKYIFA